jgi:hypothetical protein
MRVAAWIPLLCGLPAVVATSQCPEPRQNGARLLPSHFDMGRVLAAPRTIRGDTAYFILDSGGGFNAFVDTRIGPMGLATHTVGTGKDTATLVLMAAIVDPDSLPAPTAGYPRDGSLVVTDNLKGLQSHYSVPITGFLGGGWWINRVWTIDYLTHELWLYPRSVLQPGTANPHYVRLGLKRNRQGGLGSNFARFRASIDGDSLDLLFDTGATTRLTDSARAVLGDTGPKGRAGSFISSEIFDRWHARHPDWRVVERGEAGSGAALIEVPSMQIAGYTIGPVIWERREAAGFHKLMDPLMDRPIQGSLGGAGFQFFSITLDYLHALACFQR